MDQGAFGYGIPPADLQAAYQKQKEDEMRRVQMQANGFGGIGVNAENPVQSYMQQGAFGKAVEGIGNMGTSGMAGTLAALGMTAPWPLRYMITPAMGATALAKAHEGVGNFRDAYNYDQGAKMWGNTGLPGRPTPESTGGAITEAEYMRMLQGQGR